MLTHIEIQHVQHTISLIERAITWTKASRPL
jgi:hypothetical protein